MNSWKQSKKILYGVSGGIAAYKAPDLLHGLIKAGCEVETIVTKPAESFVSTLALSTLSKKRVWCEDDFFSREQGWKIPHIALTEWADIFVIAPCTANVLRMCAQGDGSTLLGAAMLANTKPLVLCPSMNSNMLSNPATQKNIEIISSRGFTIIDPDEGLLACGYEGKGRLPLNDVINEYIWKELSPKKDLLGKKILITAGPTHEYIDPVRYISNPSSGKMGYALAKAAWYRGAEVTLVSGPSALSRPIGVNFISVTSADEMYSACMENLPQKDIIIKVAAVGDFKVLEYKNKKIKRDKKMEFTLKLEQNKDIAAEIGKIKKNGQILVGFAAETDNFIENANKKIRSKNLDFIALNRVLEEGCGFGTDSNTLTVLDLQGNTVVLEGTKDDVADGLLDRISLGNK